MAQITTLFANGARLENSRWLPPSSGRWHRQFSPGRQCRAQALSLEASRLDEIAIEELVNINYRLNQPEIFAGLIPVTNITLGRTELGNNGTTS